MTPLYVRISRQQIIRTTFHFRWENPYTRNRAKPIFVPSRYLERLWRYKVSVMVKDSLEIINSDLYSFLEMSIITFFQESCLGIGKREVAGTRKWLKISFLFARGYLGNRMSYRDKWKSVLKSKIPRFQRSFTRCLKVGSLRFTLSIYGNFIILIFSTVKTTLETFHFDSRNRFLPIFPIFAYRTKSWQLFSTMKHRYDVSTSASITKEQII